jgi:hypothetical protein
MEPAWHIAAGIGTAAAVYALAGDTGLAAASGLAEILVDCDHAIEHLLRSPRPFSVRSFFHKYNSLRWPHVVFFLHSHELVFGGAIAGLFISSPLFWAVFFGYCVHMLLDQIGNRLALAPCSLSPWFYFFTYRLLSGFRSDITMRPKPEVFLED